MEKKIILSKDDAHTLVIKTIHDVRDLITKNIGDIEVHQQALLFARIVTYLFYENAKVQLNLAIKAIDKLNYLEKQNEKDSHNPRSDKSE